MEVSPEQIHDGFFSGLDHAQSYFDELESEEVDPEIIERLYEIFSAWPAELSPRFVFMFARFTGLAAGSRVANQEPSLSDDQIVAFLGHSASFFNSFKHK